MALASTASQDTEFAGLQILLKMLSARCTSISSLHLHAQVDPAAAAQVADHSACCPCWAS